MYLSIRHIIVLAVLTSVLPVVHVKAQQTMAFSTVGTDEGLSHATVISLEIDRSGYVWAGTLRGLNRHEGTRVVSYAPMLSDSTSLPASRVDAIRLTSSGDIWVGMSRGFARYNPAADAFERIDLGTAVPPIVHDIEEGPDGLLYLGTWTDGLIRYNPETGQSDILISGPHDRLDGPTPESVTIRDITFTDSRRAWITSYTGVWTFDLDSGEIGLPAWPVATLSVLAEIQSMSVLDRPTAVWFASLDGVVVVDKASGTFEVHQLSDVDTDWNYIRDMDSGRNGDVWLATRAGAVQWNDARGTFQRIEPNNRIGDRFAPGTTYAVAVDHAGAVWAGTTQEGLLRLDPVSFPLPRVERGFASNYTLPAGHVWSAAESNPSRLWLGTPDGFGEWIESEQRFHPVDLPGLGRTGVSAMKTLTNGTILLATTEFGVCRFIPVTGQCTILFETTTGVYALEQTPDGDVWAASFGHLFRYSSRTGQVRDYIDRVNPEPFGSLLILALHVDDTGDLWAGMEFGLRRYNANTDAFDIMLPDEERLLVSSIHSAGEGRLWLVGIEIHLFDPRSNEIVDRTNFGDEGLATTIVPAVSDDSGRLWAERAPYMVAYSPDGLEVDARYRIAPVRRTVDFSTTASLRLTDGRLLIGYLSGFHLFNPDSVQASPGQDVVDVVSVSYDEISHRLAPNAEVHVDHATRVLTFGLATPRFASLDSYAFEVRLDGFEPDWRLVNTNSVTYTNLKPGEYFLNVRIANPYRTKESEMRPVRLVISPPWWSSIWFLGFVVLSGMGILWSIVRWREHDLKKRSDMLDNLVRLRTSELAEKAHELQLANELKSRFFSNVSHELRTPLTLIKGYLEDAEATSHDSRLQRAVGLSDRLDALVTQLLDLARNDNNRQTMNAQRADLVRFVHRIVAHFSIAAAKAGIDLTFEHDQAEMWAHFDPLKMDQVVSNLIGNALKYTPEGGAIWVTLSGTDRNTVRLVVADSGIGIPAELLERVFERFFQVGHELTRENEGLGIGLALTKDFVEMHGGRLSVQSEEGSGTVFSAIFPGMLTEQDADASHAVYHDLSEFEPIPAADRKKLLVVEDNAELRSALVHQLSSDFDISESADGAEAWAHIRSHQVDIVLSDVMMPGMSGLDLLREVRGSEQFAHLPFVLLTARASDDAQIEGLQELADDFISKPYNARVLRARLLNIAKRGRTSRMLPAPTEDELLTRLREFILQNMSQSDLSVQELADRFFMSPRTFQRRVKEVSGESVAVYVRTVRLEHARELLEGGALASVSEAAQRTGFSNVSYFSKVYEDMYGLNPKSYM